MATHDEIWSALVEFSSGDLPVAFNAFYPEFYAAITPYTGWFNEAAAIAHDTTLGDQERRDTLINNLQWGAAVNQACTPGFDYDGFIDWLSHCS